MPKDPEVVTTQNGQGAAAEAPRTWTLADCANAIGEMQRIQGVHTSILDTHTKELQAHAERLGKLENLAHPGFIKTGLKEVGRTVGVAGVLGLGYWLLKPGKKADAAEASVGANGVVQSIKPTLRAA